MNLRTISWIVIGAILVAWLALCIIGCAHQPTPDEVILAYNGLDEPDKVIVAAKVHPSTQAAESALKIELQKKLDELAIQKRQSDQRRANIILDLSFAALFAGIVGVILLRFISFPAGWGAIGIITGIIGIGVGMLYGEITLFLSAWGQTIAAVLVIGSLAGVATAVGVLIYEYFEPPRGIKGMFLKSVWGTAPPLPTFVPIATSAPTKTTGNP